MKFQKGDMVTISDEMKKSVRDPERYKYGIVGGVASDGTVEVLWGWRKYPVAKNESELTKINEHTQAELF